MKTLKLTNLNGNYYRTQTSSSTSAWKMLSMRRKIREALTIAGGTLGLCAFMFVLYLMVLMTSRVVQPFTG